MLYMVTISMSFGLSFAHVLSSYQCALQALHNEIRITRDPLDCSFRIIISVFSIVVFESSTSLTVEDRSSDDIST